MTRVDDVAIPVLGISILGYLAVRIARLLAVADVDAVAVGLLGSFAALSAAATVLSIPHLLTGATWVACLAIVTAGTPGHCAASNIDKPADPARSSHFTRHAAALLHHLAVARRVRGVDAVRLTGREI
jgi:hypothetical protein